MKSETTAAYPWVQWRLIFLLLLTAIVAFSAGLLSAPYLTPLAQSTFRAITFSLGGAPHLRIYEKVHPSIVTVEIIESSETSPSPDKPGPGQGSGFVWDKAGHIVTNLHLVQGAGCIQVILADETRAGAQLLGSDLSTDLAVLKVNLPPDKLQPITLGDSTGLTVGQPVLAVAAPSGPEAALTPGSINALDQIMQGCDNCYPIVDVIQTDIPLDVEDSGGPLLNEQGEVIGINTWPVGRGEGSGGISFSLSSKAIEQVVPGLINSKK